MHTADDHLTSPFMRIEQHDIFRQHKTHGIILFKVTLIMHDVCIDKVLEVKAKTIVNEEQI